MHAPTDVHMNLVKKILRYVKGTISHGLHFTRSSSSYLVIYSNADWAGCPDTWCSTSGFCAYLCPNLVSWSSKRQGTVSRSSAKAEHHSVANAVTESCWLCQLLQELGQSPPRATIVFCDNINVTYMSNNLVHHPCAKYIEIDLHFVHDKVSHGEVKVLHVPSAHQFADIFTKGLSRILFEDSRCSLNILPCNVQTEGVLVYVLQCVTSH
jgi:hypothetical protein